MFKTRTSKEVATQKLKHFCGYQERSHQEVRDKLYGLGLYKPEVEEVIATLIEDNYLNETRFAEAFARGKFRIRNWGKIKIRYEMQQKGVSARCIDLALKAIPATEYQEVFEKLARRKWEALAGEKNIFARKSKWRSYLLVKGYEPAICARFSFDTAS